METQNSLQQAFPFLKRRHACSAVYVHALLVFPVGVHTFCLIVYTHLFVYKFVLLGTQVHPYLSFYGSVGMCI